MLGIVVRRRLPTAESDVPDSQPPLEQTAPALTPAPDSDPIDIDFDDMPISDRKHFNFQVICTIKNKAISSDTVNTKDWSYTAYLVREGEKLQANVNNQPRHTIVPPRFLNEMRIRASVLQPPLYVSIGQDYDIKKALRTMHTAKSHLKRKEAWATLTIAFNHVINIEPTPPASTPNPSHPVRRTATVLQREEAAAKAQFAEIISDSRTQITARYACPDALCSNNPKPRIVMARWSHLPLPVLTIHDWCTIIRDGTATVEKIPSSLTMRLVK